MIGLLIDSGPSEPQLVIHDTFGEMRGQPAAALMPLGSFGLTYSGASRLYDSPTTWPPQPRAGQGMASHWDVGADRITDNLRRVGHARRREAHHGHSKVSSDPARFAGVHRRLGSGRRECRREEGRPPTADRLSVARAEQTRHQSRPRSGRGTCQGTVEAVVTKRLSNIDRSVTR